MKKYEYKILKEDGLHTFNLKQINELAKEGWRVTQWRVFKADEGRYFEFALLEREIHEC